MALEILDSSVVAAVAAATTQDAQAAALVAPWAGGNVTARVLAGDTLLATLTQGPWVQDNGADPRDLTLGARLARTFVAGGTPTRVVFRHGSTDIFSLSAGIGSGDVSFAAAISADSIERIAGLVVTAAASLPKVTYATAFTIALAASSGATNSPVSGTVTPTGGPLSAAATVTLSCGTGTFADATLDFASGATAAQAFSFTPTSDTTHSVSMTNTLGLLNTGSPRSYTSSTTGPTSLAISGASSGTTGAAVTLTFTLNAAATVAVTVTPTPVGGVTYSTPAVIAIGQTGTTCTMTRAADGSHSVAATTSPSLTVTGGYTFTSSALSSSGDLPANTIATGSTASTAVTYGQPFKEGALSPADGLSGRQLNILTLWPDGSVKHALVTRVVSGSTSYSDTLTIGTAASGTALAIADLKAAMTDPAAFDAGAFGSASFSGTDWDTPHTVVATGPLMSSWVYRKAFSGDSHLVAWVEVRFSTGAVEVLPWVENGYLTVATPTNKSATYTFTLGGTLRFSETIDIKHHTRIPLVNTSTSEGSATSFSHWLGTDPGAAPAHDGAYLSATKVIPNLAWGAPAGATLDAQDQDYTPNTLAGDSNASGGTGGAGCLISAPSAFYVTSGGDVRAYKAMMAHALSSGSWSSHYRDDVTNLPFKFSDWPQIRLKETDSSQSVPLIPVGTGGENGSSGGGPAVSHLPSYAYLPFLVTGRWWFLEEMQFWATYTYGCLNRVDRGGDAGIYATSQVRGRSWGLNVLAQSAALTPSSHANYAEFVSSWESNTDLFRRRFVDGTDTSVGDWVHPQGFMGSYSGDAGEPSLYGYPTDTVSARPAWYDAGYQHNYMTAVFGYSSDIGIPQSAQSISDHAAVRNHSYKQVIGRAGDGLSGRYNWRRFITFAYPIGTDETGLPVETKYTAAQSYAEALTGFGLADIDPTYGGTLKRTFSASVGDIDLPSGTTASHEYGASALAGLAMAVEHGVEGATEAWNRISGASNFSVFGPFLTDVEPNWSVLPRSPSWLPAVGTVEDLTTNTVNSAAGYSSNMWKAWSGVAWAPWWGTYGSIIASGGGHTDGDKNDVYRIDIGTRLVTQIKAAATAFSKADGYIADTTTGWMWANATGGDTTVQTGEPFTPHFYGGLVALPPDFSPSGATNGSLYTGSRTGMPYTGSAGTLMAHNLRLGVDTLWTAQGGGTDLGGGYAGYDFKVFDPKRNRVWYKTDRFGNDFQYRNLSTGAETVVAFTNGSAVDSAGAVAFLMAADDCIFSVMSAGGTPVFSVTDLAATTCYSPTRTGTAPSASSGSWAWGWSDAWHSAFYFDGGNTVWFLKPTGNPRSAAWAWTSQSITGTVYPNVGGNGAFNRLRHAAILGDVLIWCPDTANPVQVIRVTAP